MNVINNEQLKNCPLSPLCKGGNFVQAGREECLSKDRSLGSFKTGLLCFFSLFFVNTSFAASPNPANLDTDQDGIPNASDVCPQIPARTSTGCPDISIRPVNPKESGIRIQMQEYSTSEYFFRDELDIRLGDIFRAVLFAPKTGDILSESEKIEVKN
ncbi:hypothetical protein K9M59_04535 [Candidatus Gracilibacteria bacterium]|nr:hypothetical protein [Candidatus Gracilibacteria bacterium]MCF7819587.1 hypothetical protein [Candidatus Gracilibacteria bacterium]